ncbi:MAG: oligosaccharide flippase family protein [Bacteroidota bacterium]
MIVILNALIKPVWVLVEMKIQDVIGHDAWGTFAALFSLAYLFLVFADLGINPYTTQKLASEPEQMKTYAPGLLSLKLLLMLLYPLVMLGIGYVLGYDGHALHLLLIICLIHAGSQLMSFFRANFRAMQKFQIDSFLSIFDRVFLLILVPLLFYVGVSLERFVWLRIFSVGVGAILFYVLMVRMYGKIRLSFDLKLLKTSLKSSFPFALMTLLYSVHDKVDQVMIERMAGELETGLYAAAYRWIDAFSMYLWLVLPIFFARFAFYLNEKGEQKKLLAFGQSISSLPIIFISVFGFFYGEKLLFLFDNSSPEELERMRICLQILFGALLINGSLTIFSTLLTSTGHVKYVNRVILASIALNIGLNAYFIPEYGAIASAWTTLLSFALANLAYMLYAAIRLGIFIPFRQLGFLLLLGILLVGGFYALAHISEIWWLNTLIAGLVYTGLAFAFRLISLSKIRAFAV